MMGALQHRMIHSCNILSSTQDQKLFFTSGSSAFTVGDPLVGIDTGATGTIKQLVLVSGTWASENAAGYLILSNVFGTFQTGESISDTHGGAALASGSAEPVTNGVGTPQLTTTTTTYSSCRFSDVSMRRGIQSMESGDYIVSTPLLFLPAEAVVMEGDLVTSDVSGYEGPYKVTHAGVQYELFLNSSGDYDIDHLEVELKAVKKRSS